MASLTEKEKKELLKWKKAIKALFLIPVKIFLFLSIKIRKQFGGLFSAFILVISCIVFSYFVFFCITFSYNKFKNYLIKECEHKLYFNKLSVESSYNECLSKCPLTPIEKCYKRCTAICKDTDCSNCKKVARKSFLDVSEICNNKCSEYWACIGTDYYLECWDKCKTMKNQTNSSVGIIKIVEKRYILAKNRCKNSCKDQLDRNQSAYYGTCESKSFSNLFTDWL